MYRAAYLELWGCALLWFLPFLWRMATAPKRKAAVTILAAEWGMLLQAISYAVLWLWQASPGEVGTWRTVLSMLAGPAAVALAWTAVPHLGKQWRINAGLYEDHELVESGPYAIVRHPIYASMLAIFLAMGLLLSRWPALGVALILFAAGTEIRVHIEDGLLESRFGERFRAYRRKVRAYVPLVR